MFLFFYSIPPFPEMSVKGIFNVNLIFPRGLTPGVIVDLL